MTKILNELAVAFFFIFTVITIVLVFTLLRRFYLRSETVTSDNVEGYNENTLSHNFTHQLLKCFENYSAHNNLPAIVPTRRQENKLGFDVKINETIQYLKTFVLQYKPNVLRSEQFEFVYKLDNYLQWAILTAISRSINRPLAFYPLIQIIPPLPKDISNETFSDMLTEAIFIDPTSFTGFPSRIYVPVGTVSNGTINSSKTVEYHIKQTPRGARMEIDNSELLNFSDFFRNLNNCPLGLSRIWNGQISSTYDKFLAWIEWLREPDYELVNRVVENLQIHFEEVSKGLDDEYYSPNFVNQRITFARQKLSEITEKDQNLIDIVFKSTTGYFFSHASEEYHEFSEGEEIMIN